MSCDFEKISAAFRMMQTVEFPDGYLAELEFAAIRAHLEATKGARAAHLLATRGREEAARLLGCSESQVYKLVRQHMASFRQSSAEIESAA